MGPLQKASA
jgi:hypothetical protein